MRTGRPSNPELLTDTLTAILEFRTENGYLPSVRELGKLLSIKECATHARLQKATKAGILRHINGHYVPLEPQ